MDYNRIKENTKDIFNSQLFWIRVCAIGIWLLVIQNYFGGKDTAQRVYVVGGQVDADVTGTVDANVSGSVDVDNTVSVEVENIVKTWNLF